MLIATTTSVLLKAVVHFILSSTFFFLSKVTKFTNDLNIFEQKNWKTIHVKIELHNERLLSYLIGQSSIYVKTNVDIIKYFTEPINLDVE